MRFSRCQRTTGELDLFVCGWESNHGQGFLPQTQGLPPCFVAADLKENLFAQFYIKKICPDWLEYLLCLQQYIACCFERLKIHKIWAEPLKAKYLHISKILQWNNNHFHCQKSPLTKQTRNLLSAFAIGNEKIAFFQINMHKMATLWSDPKSEADFNLHFWKISSDIWPDTPKIPSLRKNYHSFKGSAVRMI